MLHKTTADFLYNEFVYYQRLAKSLTLSSVVDYNVKQNKGVPFWDALFVYSNNFERDLL